MAEKFNNIVERFRNILIMLGIVNHKVQHYVAVNIIQVPLSLLALALVGKLPVPPLHMADAKYAAYFAVIIGMVWMSWLVEYFGDNDTEDLRTSFASVAVAAVWSFLLAKLFGLL